LESPTLPDIVDRAIGAFMGLAVGDALGTTLEFEPRDTRPHHTEMTGGGAFKLAPGVWTDDTSMALCLADSLLAQDRVDPQDLLRRFIRWHHAGENSPTGACFDIGIATRAALARFERTGDGWAGDPSPSAAGNGSLMRLAPVALFHCDDRDAAREAARQQSRTTHAAPECLDACGAFAMLLVDAIETGRAEARPGTYGPLCASVEAIVTGAWGGKPRDRIRSSGYVLHTLEAALWAVQTSSSFEEAVIRAVNLGDDADTVGAVTGQLAGAVWGLRGIPDRWLRPLAWRDRLQGIAHALMARATTRRGLPAFLGRTFTPDAGAAWERQVAQGLWSAIPEDLAYGEAGAFGHLLHGYDMAVRLGLGDAAGVAGRQHALFEQTGAWQGSAVELWITLFYQLRADRMSDWPGTEPAPRPHLDALCRTLRQRLIDGDIWPRKA